MERTEHIALRPTAYSNRPTPERLDALLAELNSSVPIDTAFIQPQIDELDYVSVADLTWTTALTDILPAAECCSQSQR
jgi:hypothetical protein